MCHTTWTKSNWITDKVAIFKDGRMWTRSKTGVVPRGRDDPHDGWAESWDIYKDLDQDKVIGDVLLEVKLFLPIMFWKIPLS